LLDADDWKVDKSLVRKAKDDWRGRLDLILKELG
jgi:hypothetical protein